MEIMNQEIRSMATGFVESLARFDVEKWFSFILVLLQSMEHAAKDNKTLNDELARHFRIAGKTRERSESRSKIKAEKEEQKRNSVGALRRLSQRLSIGSLGSVAETSEPADGKVGEKMPTGGLVDGETSEKSTDERARAHARTESAKTNETSTKGASETSEKSTKDTSETREKSTKDTSETSEKSTKDSPETSEKSTKDIADTDEKPTEVCPSNVPFHLFFHPSPPRFLHSCILASLSSSFLPPFNLFLPSCLPPLLPLFIPLLTSFFFPYPLFPPPCLHSFVSSPTPTLPSFISSPLPTIHTSRKKKK
jgi:hypothetical protein